MKKALKTVLALALSLSLALVLVSCGSGFDAASYTQGDLDLTFKGIASADYIKVCQTTKEDCLNTYATTWDSYVQNNVLPNLGLTRTQITDDTYNSFVSAIESIYAMSDYTVGKATKTDSGYDVEVTVRPLQFTAAVNSDELNQKVTDLANSIDATKYATQNEVHAAYYDQVLQLVGQYYTSCAQSASRGDEQDLTLHLTVDDNKTVTIDSDSYTEMLNAVVQ